MITMGDVQQTAADNPTPTPVVSLHPRIPATAIGTPTAKEKPVQSMDGVPDSLPSEEEPCGMS